MKIKKLQFVNNTIKRLNILDVGWRLLIVRSLLQIARPASRKILRKCKVFLGTFDTQEIYIDEAIQLVVFWLYNSKQFDIDIFMNACSHRRCENKDIGFLNKASGIRIPFAIS